MSKKPIIIDCDPGHDDALALLWSLSSPFLEVKAVTTVAGNQTIDKVTNNALRLLTLAKRQDIPVGRGATEPLYGEKLECGVGEIIHGTSGLDGPELPDADFEVSEFEAVELMINILDNTDEKITIVPLGPLTNIARLLVVRPDLKNKIKCISLMGGGTYGNWTPAAEYNIWVDAEAAKLVFNSGVEIIMSSIDVTQKAFILPEENVQLRNQGNKISVFASELIDYYINYHQKIEGFIGCTLHDPCAVAVLIHPEIFKSVQCNVDVEIEGELTKGMTVIDKINYQEKIFGQKKTKNVKFLYEIDREKFRDTFFEAMKNLKV